MKQAIKYGVALSHTECSFTLKPAGDYDIYTAFENSRAKVMHYMGAYIIHLMTLRQQGKRKELLAQKIHARMLKDKNYQLTDEEVSALREIESSALVFTAFRNFQQYKLMAIDITEERGCFVIGDFALIEYNGCDGFEVQALNGANINDIGMPLMGDQCEALKKNTAACAVNQLCGGEVIATQYSGCLKHHSYDRSTDTIVISSQPLKLNDDDHDDGDNVSLLSRYQHEFQPKRTGYLTAFASTLVKNIYYQHDRVLTPSKASDSLPSVENLEADRADAQKRKKQAAKHIKHINTSIKHYHEYRAKIDQMIQNQISILQLETNALEAKRQPVTKTGVSLWYCWVFCLIGNNHSALSDEIDLKEKKKKGIMDFADMLQKNDYDVKHTIDQFVNAQPKDSRLFERRRWRLFGVKPTMSNNSRTACLFRNVQQQQDRYLAQKSKRDQAICALS